MSWHVSVLENALTFDRAAIEELRATDEEGVVEFLDTNDDNRVQIYFDPDFMESIDTIWSPEVQTILLRHNPWGSVTFGQIEGDGGPKFWGYVFSPSKVMKMTGKINWNIHV